MTDVELPAEVRALVDEREQYARSDRRDRVIPVDEELAARGWVVNTAGNPVRVDKDRRAVTADPVAAADAAKAAGSEAKEAAKVKADAEKAAVVAGRENAVADEAAKRALLDQHIAEGKAEDDDDEDGKPRRVRERAVRRPSEKAVGD